VPEKVAPCARQGRRLREGLQEHARADLDVERPAKRAGVDDEDQHERDGDADGNGEETGEGAEQAGLSEHDSLEARR
jgi:hypothetical protein